MLIISTVAALGASLVGYTQSRSFVQRRLRYVDAVQKAGVPILVGAGAALAAAPVVALLPFVGAGVAAAFGLSVGAGVAAGVRVIRERRLLP